MRVVDQQDQLDGKGGQQGIQPALKAGSDIVLGPIIVEHSSVPHSVLVDALDIWGKERIRGFH
jgi:hypothetical protein